MLGFTLCGSKAAVLPPISPKDQTGCCFQDLSSIKKKKTAGRPVESCPRLRITPWRLLGGSGELCRLLVVRLGSRDDMRCSYKVRDAALVLLCWLLSVVISLVFAIVCIGSSLALSRLSIHSRYWNLHPPMIWVCVSLPLPVLLVVSYLYQKVCFSVARHVLCVETLGFVTANMTCLRLMWCLG